MREWVAKFLVKQKALRPRDRGRGVLTVTTLLLVENIALLWKFSPALSDSKEWLADHVIMLTILSIGQVLGVALLWLDKLKESSRSRESGD